MEKGRKEKKAKAVWPGFAAGALLSAGVYVSGLLLLGLLLTKGSISERNVFPWVGALCILASLSGGLLAVRKTAWKAAGLLTGVLFALLLLAVGLLGWRDGIAWLGQGGLLLLYALCGGVGVTLLSGRRRRKRK